MRRAFRSPAVSSASLLSGPSAGGFASVLAGRRGKRRTAVSGLVALLLVVLAVLFLRRRITVFGAGTLNAKVARGSAGAPSVEEKTAAVVDAVSAVTLDNKQVEKDVDWQVADAEYARQYKERTGHDYDVAGSDDYGYDGKDEEDYDRDDSDDGPSGIDSHRGNALLPDKLDADAIAKANKIDQNYYNAVYADDKKEDEEGSDLKNDGDDQSPAGESDGDNSEQERKVDQVDAPEAQGLGDDSNSVSKREFEDAGEGKGNSNDDGDDDDDDDDSQGSEEEKRDNQTVDGGAGPQAGTGRVDQIDIQNSILAKDSGSLQEKNPMKESRPNTNQPPPDLSQGAPDGVNAALTPISEQNNQADKIERDTTPSFEEKRQLDSDPLPAAAADPVGQFDSTEKKAQNQDQSSHEKDLGDTKTEGASGASLASKPEPVYEKMAIEKPNGDEENKSGDEPESDDPDAIQYTEKQKARIAEEDKRANEEQAQSDEGSDQDGDDGDDNDDDDLNNVDQ